MNHCCYIVNAPITSFAIVALTNILDHFSFSLYASVKNSRCSVLGLMIPTICESIDFRRMITWLLMMLFHSLTARVLSSAMMYSSSWSGVRFCAGSDCVQPSPTKVRYAVKIP